MSTTLWIILGVVALIAVLAKRIPALHPYVEKESLAAFFLGVSSGFPYAMIGATLTTRLAQDGIDKKTVTAFTLAFLVYNLKVFWAWIVDGVHLPLIGRLGQRVSWMVVAGVLVIAAVVNLALVDPKADIAAVATAAILVGIAGATFDIVIDAYRIETLKPYQLGVGSGMSQYGWRIGSAGAEPPARAIGRRRVASREHDQVRIPRELENVIQLQQAAGQGIQRPRMAGLLGPEQPLCRLQGVVGRDPDRLVEQQAQRTLHERQLVLRLHRAAHVEQEDEVGPGPVGQAVMAAEMKVSPGKIRM